MRCLPTARLHLTRLPSSRMAMSFPLHGPSDVGSSRSPSSHGKALPRGRAPHGLGAMRKLGLVAPIRGKVAHRV